MSRSQRRLFFAALISGASLCLGLPGLGTLITLIWDTAQEPVSQAVPAEYRVAISLVSLAVFLFATYLTWEIYLKGAKKGTLGLTIVILGVVTGFALASLVIGALAGVLVY